jgi:SWI/SNF-related matrix-associated actin-dependent regulator 1 of chromatin subfamily A
MREYIEDLLEAGHKMLLFAHHQSVLDAFEAAFMEKHHRHIRIDGRTPPSGRQELCNAFQQDVSIRIALLSITAASTGLTLTAATTVVFAELFWNPGVMVQAEDRAHRIGQCDSVSVHYLLARGTTDDNVWPLILRKLNTLESVGLGKNDFKGMANREHDKAQPHVDLMLKAKRLRLRGEAAKAETGSTNTDHGIVVIDDDDDEDDDDVDDDDE